MMSNEQEDKDPLRENFPIYLLVDFDTCLNQYSDHLIGMNKEYPQELFRKVAAAAISYELGYKSIDYVYRRFLLNYEYDSGLDGRLDRDVEESIRAILLDFNKKLYDKTTTPNKVAGEILAEWALLRLPYAFNVTISTCHKGALYESLALIRVILEQVAWAVSVINYTDIEYIQRQSATKSITVLKRISNIAGVFYRWLSEHSHWAYEAHIKSIVMQEGKMANLYASYRFKAVSMSATLVALKIVDQICSKILGISLVYSHLDDSGASITEAASARITTLARRLQSIGGDDRDIRVLADLAI